MGGSSKKQTVGYKYFLGMHLIFVHGPVDKIRNIKVDDRIAWQGDFAGGRINIAAENLFGGIRREGGVSGAVDFESGTPTQTKNDYLQSQLGTDIPAFRRVAGLVLRQCYLGMNPYLKKWAARMQRIHVRQDGLAQWYPAKAAIASGVTNLLPSEILVTKTAEWSYKHSTMPDFQIGLAPFGDGTHPSPPADWPATPATIIPDGGNVIIRKEIQVPLGRVLQFETFADNTPTASFGGVNIPLTQIGTWVHSGTFTPTISSGLLELVVVDTSPQGAGNFIHANATVYANEGMGPQYDMNPIHIIRECLTDPDWGMGYQDADIDNVSFTAAADKLSSEAMGISILWDRQGPIESFVKEILRHIDASLYVNRTTGKFAIKLIRADFVESSLLVLNESNLQKVEDYGRPSFGELTNAVTVNFWDASTGNTGSVSVMDTALVQLQQSTNGTTISFPGFTNHGLATRVAMRSLRALSTPLLTCTIYANRVAENLNIGDAFKLEWPDYHDGQIIMRVTGLAFGDGRNNVVRINCIQDAFSLPTTGVITQPGVEWVDPSQVPAAATQRIVVEAPYYELVQRWGQSNTNNQLTIAPDLGYVLASAVRPTGAINATMAVDSGAGYQDVAIVDFSPAASLSSAITPGQTVIPISNGVDLDLLEIGTHAQIGNELVRIAAFSSTSLTVGRGVLDTVPAAHASGVSVISWDAYASEDQTEYVKGEQLSVKLMPSSGAGALAITAAPIDTITMTGRAFRPYPPGNFRINGLAYPASAIVGSLTSTWAHRDRLLQTAGTLQDTTVGNIGPETGTTYTVTIYRSDGTTIISSYPSQSGTTWAWGTDEAVATNNLSDSIQTISVKSVRASLDSHQSQTWQVERAGLGYNLGNHLGGI